MLSFFIGLAIMYLIAVAIDLGYSYYDWKDWMGKLQPFPFFTFLPWSLVWWWRF